MAAACVLVGGLLAVGVEAAAGSAPMTLYAAAATSGSGNCLSVANACTLSTALADTAAGDVVELVTAGIEGTTTTYYSGNLSIGTAGTSALFPVVIEPAPGVSDPILDGGLTVLTVTNNMYLVINGVTIQGGGTSPGHVFAGGIYNGAGGTLTVNGSNFTDNIPWSGGAAILNGDSGTSGTLTVTNSTFTNNSASNGPNGAAIDSAGSGTVTVTGSTFTGNVAGAINNVGSGAMTVTDSTFTNNGFYGAIVNRGSSILTVTDSNFTGNHANQWGGAISGSGTVTDSTFSHNTAGQSGGAISGGGSVTNSTFIGNTAGQSGGAISGVGSVTDSTFIGNTAGQSGGAIDNADGGSGTLTVTGSTFTGDTTSQDGGAIASGDNGGSGTLTMTGSTFTGNTASQDGGAIDNADGGSGTLTVTGSTFKRNAAVDGGAIDSGDEDGTGNVVAAADIFAGRCVQGTGIWTDDGYNVGSNTSCQNGGTGDVTSATLARLLGPLANNGGPTQTMLLLPGNPASGVIPNGSGVLCPIAADQTGAASPPGAPCNAGALQPHPAITSINYAGTASAPQLVVKGSGFGTLANLGVATPACGGSGSDYANTLHVSDFTRGWSAGQDSGTCSDVGLFVTSYSNTKVVFHFGSKLASSGGLRTGDQVTLSVLGATVTNTATL